MTDSWNTLLDKTIQKSCKSIIGWSFKKYRTMKSRLISLWAYLLMIIRWNVRLPNKVIERKWETQNIMLWIVMKVIISKIMRILLRKILSIKYWTSELRMNKSWICYKIQGIWSDRIACKNLHLEKIQEICSNKYNLMLRSIIIMIHTISRSGRVHTLMEKIHRLKKKGC